MKTTKVGVWRVGRVNDWLFVCCPIMEDAEASRPFAVRRKIIVGLRAIERMIPEMKLKGWMGYTKLQNPHIMKMWANQGGVPFRINVKSEELWFKKDI